LQLHPALKSRVPTEEIPVIQYEKHTLPNGLVVVANHDVSSQLAAVNLLYRVGSRNEEPGRTGFAHLFEHLMFRGTKHIPDYDIPVQMASGENNAFTNSDYTDYYVTLPKDNIETALWLESDRMTGLDINAKNLDGEKKVVLEEYNQRYLNQPYGDLWLLLRPLAYKVHPYRWPAIGRSPQEIEKATLADVCAFYKAYYNPSNAILCVSGDIPPDEVFRLASTWFGSLSANFRKVKPLLPEPPQTEARRLEVVRDVATPVITIAFRMGGRTDPQFYRCDVISDLLSGGTSSRLYRRLVQERRLFSSVNAYVSGEIDPGLFVVSGYLLPEVTMAQAEEALWEEFDRLKNESVGDYELEKVKNKFEANTLFGELNVMNKALNLCFYEMLGDISLVNRETAIYRSVTAADIAATAAEIFTPERSSTLLYHAAGGRQTNRKEDEVE